MNRSLNVGLLSHYFLDDNLGCVALSQSNISLIDQAALDRGIEVHYTVFAPDSRTNSGSPNTLNHAASRSFPRARSVASSPISFFRTNHFSDCDLVININAGDGFTDLYGQARLFAESYMSWKATREGVPLVIAPQTIGPFRSTLSRMVARAVLSSSDAITVRDPDSASLAARLANGVEVCEVIDVAFALPFEAQSALRPRRVAVGINVSGLLYNGGYNSDNYFGLSLDYREYTRGLIVALLDRGVDLHLVPHVISADNEVDDDYRVAVDLASEFDDLQLAPAFTDPVEAKSYIASMDFFIGARMHATIAAISSHTPVMPIGYSKKLPALYDALEYPFYMDARRVGGASEAISRTLDMFDRRAELRIAAENSTRIAKSRLNRYRVLLGDVLDRLAS